MAGPKNASPGSDAGAAAARIVKCPTCSAEVAWGPQSPFRPFCSERCRLIDFGAWANESYRIAAVDDDEEEPGGGREND